MECAAHPGAVAARACLGCGVPRCEAFFVYEVDGESVCGECGARHSERGEALGGAQIGFIGVGYLATLALGFEVFRARPFVGGLAAVASVGLARVMQTFLRPPLVTRRHANANANAEPPRVDAPERDR